MPPRRPSYSGPVWLAPEGAVQHGSPVTETRKHCWCGPATPAQSGRQQQARSSAAALAGGKGAGWPSYSSTAWPAPTGTVWQGCPVPVARAGFQSGPAKVAMSGQPRKALSHVAARSRRQGGAARVAQLRQNNLAAPSRHRLARRPGAGGKGALTGQPRYACIVWPAPVGAMWRNSSVLATRGSCRGNPTTAAQSCRPRQALSITAAWCQQQGGATRVAQLQWHCLAGPGSTVRHVGLAMTARGRCWGNPAMETWSGKPWQAAGAARQWRHQPAGPGLHRPAQRPGANSGEALPGRTSYGSIVWSDLAVAVRHSGLEAAASRHHQDGPAEVAWSGWPHQVLSSMAAPCRWRRCAGRQLDWAARSGRPRQAPTGAAVW